ncbi:DUF3087 family protein [Ferrimonas balearica]|uniref:DUF3087 family protein n=1 Tax=Ferrimonas balearica TaxID=44012 RepID=UPI001C999AEB|nr:DUF3087 family protein [Ferrimonas balearica]MBY5922023.1 DUF3087 domain-containing protein [Ferrimonas balearica]MBY5994637.1 DUF3087 domain-containing protein [Ferrimonas balearica]
MELRKIEASHYRRQVNQVTLGFVMALAVLSVAFGSLLIALFGQGAVTPGESTGNFHLNLMGVVLALALCSALLAGLKDKPFMADVVYVWQLKQMHNRIYRKLKAVEAAAEQGDVNAMSVLDFYHRSRELVYRLDNNTLTLSAVARDQEKLAALVAQHQATLPPFDAAMLDRF